MDIVLVFVLLVTALILFATDWLRMDLVSLLLLLALAATGLVTIDEAFSGFSNPAVITVAAMFIISAGLTRTGALSVLSFAGLLTIVAIDHPFAGSVKVGPEALSKVIEDFATTRAPR